MMQFAQPMPPRKQVFAPIQAKLQTMLRMPMAFPQVDPPKGTVACEEVTRVFMFLFVATYMIGHMLFLPIEFLFLAFLTEKGLEQALYTMIAIYAAKYIGVIMWVYTAYHHKQLWTMHSHWELYLFGVYTLGLTAFYGWMVFSSDAFYRKHGFGPIYDHPLFYDIIGGCVCGVLATFYIFYMACTKPVTSGYSLIPIADPSAFRRIPHMTPAKPVAAPQEKKTEVVAEPKKVEPVVVAEPKKVEPVKQPEIPQVVYPKLEEKPYIPLIQPMPEVPKPQVQKKPMKAMAYPMFFYQQ